MSLLAKHDRITLVRLVKGLERIVSDDSWADGDQSYGGDVWVKAQGMSQKIRYARQLLSKVVSYETLYQLPPSLIASQPRHWQTIQETLDRLDTVVYAATQRLEPEPVVQTSYLSLVPLPTTAEETVIPDRDIVEPLAEAELLASNSVLAGPHHPPVNGPSDPALDLLPSIPRPPASTGTSATSQPLPTSSLLSASLHTHDELSNELSQMAIQLKRNAQYFAESLEKDKSFVHSAAEALEKNYDAMAKERVRLKDHRSKTFGTTWMVFGALLVVSLGWVAMFFIIRFT